MTPLPFPSCCCLIQFKAICEEVLFISFATTCTSVAIAIFLSFTNDALIGLLTLYLFWSVLLSCLLYFPERTPPPKGDHIVAPTSKPRAMGNSSLSADLSIKLYINWIPMKGDQPRSSAIAFAYDTTHAGASDIPTYRIFPDFIKSSKDLITSSIGVIGSHMCTQSRSMYCVFNRLRLALTD